ncbi:hypothetical protein ACFL5B_03310 [Candidatus Latescibacterota bacterium]
MKQQLYSFREGWQSENLARYILSKFSFIANPVNVSDDIGSDFFCNIFQIYEENGHDYLLPKNAFAIQIKSDSKKIEISNKIKYLESLKIPFFVGVINKNELKLTIYSGEYIPELFSLKYPEKLEIELCDKIVEFNYYSKTSDTDFIIKFPKITEITATINREDLKKAIDTLSDLCDRIQRNIATRNNKEYIFYDYDGNEKKVRIFAGKDSVEVFRRNFYERLAEVFYNLTWIYINDKDKFDYKEFEIYEKLYYKLKDKFGDLNNLIANNYQELKLKIDSSK